jgi:hypothetical protein
VVFYWVQRQPKLLASVKTYFLSIYGVVNRWSAKRLQKLAMAVSHKDDSLVIQDRSPTTSDDNEAFPNDDVFFFLSGVALSGVAATSESTTTASLSIVSPFPINCRTCPFGFYDGCNVCGCSNSSGAIPKISFCTQRNCPKYAYGRP